MTASSHVIAGCLIAAFIPVPAVALPLALASHFAMDAVPHYGGDPRFPIGSKGYNWMLFGDIALATILLGIVLAYRPEHWPLIIAAGVIAASPDLMWLPSFIRGVRRQAPKPRNWLQRFHAWVQWRERPQYAVTELTWLTVSGLLFLAFIAY